MRNTYGMSAMLTLVLGSASHASRLGQELSGRSGSHSKCEMMSAFCRVPHVKRAGNRVVACSEFPSDSDLDAPPTVPTLLRRARKVRETMLGDDALPSFILDSSRLKYPASAYNMGTEDRKGSGKATVQRGFCNWLVPEMIMIGQYPGTTPEKNGASSKECQLHIQNMVQDACISMFCCLQTEVPAQDNDTGWTNGDVYLQPASVRREFPRPFTRYGPLAQSYAESPLTFLHNPIEDLSVPTCNDALLSLLSRLLEHLESDEQRTIYLHCWGGRGRAGLVGACVASLLFPELSAAAALEWVQRAYDARAGARSMPSGLRRSPQTEQQRRFVGEFVALVHSETKGKGTLHRGRVG